MTIFLTQKHNTAIHVCAHNKKIILNTISQVILMRFRKKLKLIKNNSFQMRSNGCTMGEGSFEALRLPYHSEVGVECIRLLFCLFWFYITDLT